MLPSPEQVKGLVDLGFAVVFVAMVIAIAVGAIRGWWVPGWIYRALQALFDRVMTALDVLTKAAEASTRADSEISARLEAVETAVKGIRDDIDWNLRDRNRGRGSDG